MAFVIVSEDEWAQQWNEEYEDERDRQWAENERDRHWVEWMNAWTDDWLNEVDEEDYDKEWALVLAEEAREHEKMLQDMSDAERDIEEITACRYLYLVPEFH